MDSYLPNNIKVLRKHYGQTQEELADYLGYTKNEISHYENGKRTPDHKTIKAIADYYLVTVEDLLHQDLSAVELKQASVKIDTSYMSTMFPIVADENALENKNFEKAFRSHCAFMKLLEENNPLALDGLDLDITDLYEHAKEDPNAREAASINYISLILMLFWFFETSSILESDKAAIDLLKKKNPEASKNLDKNDFNEFINDSKKLKSEWYSEVSDDVYKDLKTLCHSSEYADMAYYYLALCYWVNFTDNEHGLVWNQRVSYEMMLSLVLIGNKHAASLLVFFGNRS